MFKCAFALGAVARTVAIEAVHALHLRACAATRLSFRAHRAKSKNRSRFANPIVPPETVVAPGSSKRPETIAVRIGRCPSKPCFLALLTRGVDLGFWFALAQGAVDRQVGSSLMAI